VKLAILFEKFGTVIATTLRRRRVVENGKQKVSWALISFAEPSQAKAAVAGAESLGFPEMVIRTMDMDQAMNSKGDMSQVAKQHHETELAAVRDSDLFSPRACTSFAVRIFGSPSPTLGSADALDAEE